MKLIDIFQKLDESSVNEVHSHNDDYEDCDACNGTGEGRWEGETCHACHGSGIQEPEHDDDDFDIPDDDFDGGDEESYYEKSLRSRGLEEGTGNVGNAIKSLYQKIYAAGDDEVEYFYHDSPIFAQYWDEYEGDLDSIIAEVDPAELQVMLDELESYVQQANLAEGWTKLPNGNYRNMHTGVQQSKPPVKKKRGEKTGAEWDAIEKTKKDKEQGVAEGEQQKGADYRDPPEADYGDDYQDMVARVKKLAGLGPLKTVWDPQKRVYKNVPTAVQPKK